MQSRQTDAVSGSDAARRRGITLIEEANAFIRDVYLPAHNARFAVAPAEPGSVVQC